VAEKEKKKADHFETADDNGKKKRFIVSEACRCRGEFVTEGRKGIFGWNIRNLPDRLSSGTTVRNGGFTRAGLAQLPRGGFVINR